MRDQQTRLAGYSEAGGHVQPFAFRREPTISQVPHNGGIHLVSSEVDRCLSFRLDRVGVVFEVRPIVTHAQ